MLAPYGEVLMFVMLWLVSQWWSSEERTNERRRISVWFTVRWQ